MVMKQASNSIKQWHYPLCVLLLLLGVSLRAQDLLPPPAPRQFSLHYSAPPILPTSPLLPFFVDPEVQLPTSFRGLSDNHLQGTLTSLVPLFQQIRNRQKHQDTTALRILFVGDSHIHAHTITEAFAQHLRLYIPHISCQDMGINGAMVSKYATPSRIRAIKAAQPDFIILSFGTNESHNTRYTTAWHEKMLLKTYEMLQTQLPHVPILLTTPPGSYLRYRISRRKYGHRPNPFTEKAAQTICHFSQTHHLPYWDLYHLMGGNQYALSNWQSAQLMRPDHIHYTLQGYTLQGQLLSQAFIKAYHNYVRHQ